MQPALRPSVHLAYDRNSVCITQNSHNARYYLLLSVVSPDPRGWGGQRLGSLGPSGVQGQSPGGGLEAKTPEADAYIQVCSCEKSLFSL